PERRPARGLRAEQTLHPQCLRRRASEELADRRAKASQDRDQAHAQGPLPSSRSNRSGHDQGRGTGDQAGELTARLACCKVGLDGPLIPTAVVANLFRSARVSRPRRSADLRSQRTEGQETTARTSYRQRLFVEHDLGESSGSSVDVARRAGYPWPEKLAPQLV